MKTISDPAALRLARAGMEHFRKQPEELRLLTGKMLVRFVVLGLLLLLLPAVAHATIYDRRDGRAISSTTISRGADLSGMKLAYADLAYKNLVGVNFAGADLSHADLFAATVSGDGFVNANADFTGADLSFADLSGLNARALVLQEGMSFRGADLTGADFTGAELYGCDFTSATIDGANFDGAFLDGAIGLEDVRASATAAPEPGTLGLMMVGALLLRRKAGA